MLKSRGRINQPKKTIMNIEHGTTFDCYGDDPPIDVIAEALGNDCAINLMTTTRSTRWRIC